MDDVKNVLRGIGVAAGVEIEFDLSVLSTVPSAES